MHRFRTASISCTRSTFSTSKSETQEPHASPSADVPPGLGPWPSKHEDTGLGRGWGRYRQGTCCQGAPGCQAHLHRWRSRRCNTAGLGDGQGCADICGCRGCPAEGRGTGSPPRCRLAQAHQQRDPCSRQRAALCQAPPQPFREAGDRRSCRVKPCREHASPGEAPGRGAGGGRPSPSACTAAARFTRWSASSMASAGPSGSSRESPMTRMRISVSSRMGTSEQRRRKKLRAEWAAAGS